MVCAGHNQGMSILQLDCFSIWDSCHTITLMWKELWSTKEFNSSSSARLSAHQPPWTPAHAHCTIRTRHLINVTPQKQLKKHELSLGADSFWNHWVHTKEYLVWARLAESVTWSSSNLPLSVLCSLCKFFSTCLHSTRVGNPSAAESTKQIHYSSRAMLEADHSR